MGNPDKTTVGPKWLYAWARCDLGCEGYVYIGGLDEGTLVLLTPCHALLSNSNCVPIQTVLSFECQLCVPRVFIIDILKSKTAVGVYKCVMASVK